MGYKRPLYQHLASLIEARLNCIALDNDFASNHEDAISTLASNYLPRGSGFDSGTTVDLESSKSNRLVIQTSYHHMNDGGYYDGWTEHSVIVTPSLAFGFDLRITGRDRREFKEYALELFQSALGEEIELPEAIDKVGDNASK